MDFFEKIISFFRRLRKNLPSEGSSIAKIGFESNVLPSSKLHRQVLIDLYLPRKKNTIWSLLLLNDGQDAGPLDLKAAHQQFDASHNSPLMIVTIHAGNRKDEYGTANQLSDKGLGTKSAAYQEFILEELLPYLHRRYPISADPGRVGIAGFSLGGLSAIDLAWRWPKIFGIVGIFSGSLWWRDQPFDPAQPDSNRIIHRRVEQGELREQRFWAMAGTKDETSDRNKNGIIDAIDDTIHLFDLLENKVLQPRQNLKFLELEGGEHQPSTWKKVLPDFLSWAFADF